MVSTSSHRSGFHLSGCTKCFFFSPAPALLPFNTLAVHRGKRSAFLNHSVAFNPISSDSAPSQKAQLAHFHQPLLTPCIIPLMFLKTECSPISTVRWCSRHVTHYQDEAAQMIYRETLHPDVISTIQPFCFSDVWEAQMFPTAAAPSKRVSELPAVTAKLYPEESC